MTNFSSESRSFAVKRRYAVQWLYPAIDEWWDSPGFKCFTLRGAVKLMSKKLTRRDCSTKWRILDLDTNLPVITAERHQQIK
jgi:hypothetical protein